MTKEFLGDAQWKGSWGVLTPGMRKGMQMVCPNSEIEGKRYTGDAVAEGVREFFGIRGVTGANAVPRQVENLLVGYANGVAPVVMYPDDVELQQDWNANDEEPNENFAMADFHDDGRIMKEEGTTEGPFEA